jgi:hypothetical protein
MCPVLLLREERVFQITHRHLRLTVATKIARSLWPMVKTDFDG